MKRIIIPFVLIVILAFQGVAMELLPPSIKFAKVYLTPHWILIFLILVAGFVYPQKPMIPIIYAAVFGLMTDIVYTGVLGVYMFVIAMSLYVAQLLYRLLQVNLLMVSVISIISLLIVEISLLAIYSLIGYSTMPLGDFFIYRFLPTILANILFLIIIYLPSRRLLLWSSDGDAL
ncbi:MAG TPA: rod shape-determining protein MreD [Pseudogracilibacillus sp.]|nr:rod shape-determining protein MreD [Pseudogracilibacillus sp.]